MRFFFIIAFVLSLPCAYAQQGASPVIAPAEEGTQISSVDDPTSPEDPQAGQSDSSNHPPASPEPPDAKKQQPKRILGVMPNYRAVSAVKA